MKNTIFVYFLITLIVVIIIYFVLRRVGIIEKPESKEESKAKADSIKVIKDLNQMVLDFKSFPYWDPQRMNEIPFPSRMSYDNSTNIAKQIEDSWGWLNDNENRVYAAFQKIPRQRDVSSIAYYYQQLFDRELFADLIDRLNNNEIRNVWSIIANKPR